jgi:hypothetical protein
MLAGSILYIDRESRRDPATDVALSGANEHVIACVHLPSLSANITCAHAPPSFWLTDAVVPVRFDAARMQCC